MPPSRHREVRFSPPDRPRPPAWAAGGGSLPAVQVLAFDVGRLACAVGASQSEGARASARDARPRCAAGGSGGVRAPGSDRHGDRPRAPARRRALAKAAGVARRRRARRRGDVRARDGGRDRALLGGPGGARSATRACGGEDLLRGITLQPDGPLLVLDLDRSSTRRRFAGRESLGPGAAPGALGSRRQRSAAPVAVQRVEPVASATRSAAGDDRPGACASMSRVPPRLAAPRPAPAAPCRQRDRPRLARAGASPRASGGRAAAGGVASRAPPASPGAGGDGPRAGGGRRRSPGRDPLGHRFHGGVLGAAAVAAVALVALLVRWSATPRCADARAVAPLSTGHRAPRSSTHRCRPPPAARAALRARTQHLGLVHGAGRRAAHPAPRVVRGRGPWRFALAPRWRHLGARSAWPRLPRPEPRRDRGSGSDRPRAAPRLAGGGALRAPWLTPSRRPGALMRSCTQADRGRGPGRRARTRPDRPGAHHRS